MNVKRIVEKHVASLFKTMKGMVKDAVYMDLTSYGHDSAYKGTAQYTDTPIKAIVTSYQQNKIDYAGGRIESSDKKILIPLKGLNINPNTNGKIQIDNTEYEIKHVETDPTGALCTVQARL
jgi:hypothetical protein